MPPFHTVSLSASGLMVIYQLGVLAGLSEKFDMDGVRYVGASAGALAGAAMCTGQNLRDLAGRFIASAPTIAACPRKMATELERNMFDMCPNDAAEACTGRLSIVTSVLDVKYLFPRLRACMLPNTYASNTQLLESLRASCHVPLVCGVLPRTVSSVPGWHYDAMLTEPQPQPQDETDADGWLRINWKQTEEADIVPSVPLGKWWCINPPAQDVLWGIYWLGVHDAKCYWLRMYNAKCYSQR